MQNSGHIVGGLEKYLNPFPQLFQEKHKTDYFVTWPSNAKQEPTPLLDQLLLPLET